MWVWSKKKLCFCRTLAVLTVSVAKSFLIFFEPFGMEKDRSSQGRTADPPSLSPDGKRSFNLRPTHRPLGMAAEDAVCQALRWELAAYVSTIPHLLKPTKLWNLFGNKTWLELAWGYLWLFSLAVTCIIFFHFSYSSGNIPVFDYMILYHVVCTLSCF